MDNETRLKKLEEWKRARETQQITFPLDPKSIEILQNYFMRILGTLSSFDVNGEIVIRHIGKQANLEFVVDKNNYIAYSVDVAGNLVIPTVSVMIEDGAIIKFATDGTLPGGITTSDFFVINSTGESFQISTTFGGSAVDITSLGTGRQWFFVY